MANKEVDLGAKQARFECHQWIHKDAEILLDREVADCKLVCRVAGATLEQYPKMSLTKLPREHRERAKRLTAGWHDWQAFEGTWRCRHCLFAAPDGTRQAALQLESCKGRPRALRRLLALGDTQGHKLQRCDTAAGQPLFFCVACGSWAVNKCIKLMLPCEKQALRGSAGWDALRRIHRHQHPDYHGHAREALTTPFRHSALEGPAAPRPSTSSLFAPPDGHRLAALRARIGERERAKSQ